MFTSHHLSIIGGLTFLITPFNYHTCINVPNWFTSTYCQMLFFLITCSFSFIFFYKSFSSFRSLSIWASDMRILFLWFWKDFSFQTHSITDTLFGITHSLLSSRPMIKNLSSKVESVEMMSSEMCVLDLPDLALESILEKLPPEGLCVMASVCVSLRDRCISDHFWEQHMKNKWGGVVGSAAYRNWQWYIASSKNSIFFNQGKQKGVWFNYFADFWPLALIRSTFSNINRKRNFPPIDSVMSWYLALESGKFWFPAQVYNRENGHVGFMLSCYDAEICYDQKTDTFQARYPPHGGRASTIETGITWDRVRAPLVDESPHDLHVSDCLNELYPGDHIEIQWRRNTEFPYGWWYGVVGHLETCDGNANYCQCHDSDTLVLEFKQYTRGSRWRRTSVSRKDHREEGNETDGFYGGIHKLCHKEEISTWKNLWPADILE